MASTSDSDGISGRIRNAASVLVFDQQSLIADIRKAVAMMKNVAVDLERENQSEMVRDLETAVAELLEAYEDSTHYSTAIESVANAYCPRDELTDFKKLLDDEFVKLKAANSAPPNHPLMRQFKEAIWNVHHERQPMPGDEQEDIVMTSTQCSLLNVTCPLTGKPVIELASPVRSMECKHIYDRKAVMSYISKRQNACCPVAGCPKRLQKEKVVCDPLLKVEIEEMRSITKETATAQIIEDITEPANDEEEPDQQT